MKEKSLFIYDDGLTFRDFYHPEFVPLFLDEVDESRLNEAKAKCGLSPSASCISDYLATGDIEVALSSGKSEETSDKNIAELGSVNFKLIFLYILDRYKYNRNNSSLI